MSTKPVAWKVALLALWSAAVTALTFVLGGAVLRTLRVYAGENVYWLTSLLITSLFLLVGWEAYAMIYFGSVLLIGVFSDLEERGFSYFRAGCIALTIVGLVAGGIFAFWFSHQGPEWFDSLVAQAEQPLLKVFPADPELPVRIGDVLRQLPSLVIMLYVFSLYFALLFERRLLKRVGSTAAVHRDLLNFKVPDVFIWILIPSLFGTFAQVKDPFIHTVAINVFNICLLVYFFQGMAVISTFFGKIKMSPFWQILLTVFLALQLFLFVGVVGVVDYWMDFRKKMKAKPAEVNKQIYRNK